MPLIDRTTDFHGIQRCFGRRPQRLWLPLMLHYTVVTNRREHCHATVINTMEKDAKRDSKLFNIYNGSVVRNWQPQQLHCFRLDTSVGYSTWEGLQRKYLTNLMPWQLRGYSKCL